MTAGPRSIFERLFLWMFACLATVLAAPIAFAGDGHGWFVIDSAGRQGSPRATVVHLPPSDSVSKLGIIRDVQGLNRVPERIAWIGPTVYLLMPAERVGEHEVVRRIMSISATPGVVSGWQYEPADGPRVLPMLAGGFGARDLDVAGFAATSDGPAVLFKRSIPPAHAASTNGATVMAAETQWTLAILDNTGWIDAPLPWSDSGSVTAPTGHDLCRLLTSSDGLVLLIEHDNQNTLDVFEGAFEPTATPDGPVRRLRWMSQPSVTAAKPGFGRGSMFRVDDQLVRVVREQDGADISVLRPGGETVIARVKAAGIEARIAAVDGSPGFLAFLWPTGVREPAAGETIPRTTYKLHEITTSGRVRYDGQVKQDAPISMREIQILFVVLVVVMAAVIVFVLRPDNRVGGVGGAAAANFPAPQGYQLADASRRILATLLDLFFGLGMSAAFLKVDVQDLLKPEFSLTSPRMWIWIGCAWALTMLLGVVMEWRWGRSLGKSMLNCRVVGFRRVATRAPVDVQEGEQAPKAVSEFSARVPLSASLTRNLGKWMPWTVVEFLATSKPQHWGDRHARTVVLAPIERQDSGDSRS